MVRNSMTSAANHGGALTYIHANLKEEGIHEQDDLRTRDIDGAIGALREGMEGERVVMVEKRGIASG
jgi:hypothetical protein